MQLITNNMHLGFDKGNIVLNHMEAESKISPQRLPFNNLSELHLDTNTKIDVALLFELLNGHIPVFINKHNRLPISLASDRVSSIRTGIKKKWFAITNNKELSLNLAKRLVSAKIKRQRRLIRQLAQAYSLNNTDIMALLATPTPDLTSLVDIQSLLGKEGHFAKLYFHALKHFTPEWCGFVHRKKRPPPDPVNILLSLSYTLIQDVLSKELLKAGFEPIFGVLHQEQDYRMSLSCDIMELWRTATDKWVLYLLNENLIQSEHFTFSDNREECVLNSIGKMQFYKQWHCLRRLLVIRVNKQISYFRDMVNTYA